MIAEFMYSRNGRHFADQLGHGDESTVEYITKVFPGYDPSGEDWFIKAVAA
jgi:hypothetical protein